MSAPPAPEAPSPGGWARTEPQSALIRREVEAPGAEHAVLYCAESMSLLRALRYRPFALLGSGQMVSRLGDSLYRIARAWWVLEITGWGLAMGNVLTSCLTVVGMLHRAARDLD